MLPNWDFIGAVMWGSGFVIQPFPVFPLVDHCIRSGSCSIYGFAYNSPSEPNGELFRLFSVLVVVVSLSAVWAAISLTRKSRVAEAVWLALLVFSFIAAAANTCADFANWGVYPNTGKGASIRSLLYFCLAASYLLAYILVKFDHQTSMR